MSNDPAEYISQAQQYDIDRADNALDALRAIPKKIRLLLLDFAYTHNAGATAEKGAEAMVYIQEIIDDLFHTDEQRWQQIAGYRGCKADELTKIAESLAELHNKLPTIIRPVPTNPASYDGGAL